MSSGNLYVWDIGFDLADFQDQHGRTPLQIGFVQIDTAQGSVPATPVKLQVGDSISINGFNVTDKAVVTDPTAITGGEITIVDARTNQPASPFTTDPVTNPIFTIPNLGPANPGTGPSAIFSGNPPDATTMFPKWWPVMARRPVTNNGHFRMTVVLNVKDPSGNDRIFIVDPQMIIGGAG